MPDLWDSPIGTDGFEFISTPPPIPGPSGPCSSAWASGQSRSTARRT